mmetsp:Transcript_11268/g.45494  ORF Transcript_11268/g.45494 Transcript_11268/m.45494 type:complete len:317 (+) Transcript_11268:1604-2554(+)
MSINTASRLLIRGARLSHHPDRDGGAVPSQRDPSHRLHVVEPLAAHRPRPHRQLHHGALVPGQAPRRPRRPRRLPGGSPRRVEPGDDRAHRRLPGVRLRVNDHPRPDQERNPDRFRRDHLGDDERRGDAREVDVAEATPGRQVRGVHVVEADVHGVPRERRVGRGSSVLIRVFVPGRALHRANPRDDPRGHDQHRVTLTNRPGRHLTPHGARSQRAVRAGISDDDVGDRHAKRAGSAAVDGGQRVDGLGERSAGPPPRQRLRDGNVAVRHEVHALEPGHGHPRHAPVAEPALRQERCQRVFDLVESRNRVIARVHL